MRNGPSRIVALVKIYEKMRNAVAACICNEVAQGDKLSGSLRILLCRAILTIMDDEDGDSMVLVRT